MLCNDNQLYTDNISNSQTGNKEQSVTVSLPIDEQSDILISQNNQAADNSQHDLNVNPEESAHLVKKTFKTSNENHGSATENPDIHVLVDSNKKTKGRKGPNNSKKTGNNDN